MATPQLRYYIARNVIILSSIVCFQILRSQLCKELVFLVYTDCPDIACHLSHKVDQLPVDAKLSLLNSILPRKLQAALIADTSLMETAHHSTVLRFWCSLEQKACLSYHSNDDHHGNSIIA